ncbi:hypothetical protein ACHJH3_05960 [Campylobacter sp. MOP7]|uniref:hypothetical protein n=1 Tax=Campylobacter canis TaxID=3378588 RepID=UPI00387EB408
MNFTVKAIHEQDGYEYSWNLSFDEFRVISEALNNSNEDQAVLVLVHTCYGPKFVRVVGVTASDSGEFERGLLSPLWLTVVNQEEIGEYIPDFFPSDDYQDQEEEDLRHPIVVDETTYETPCQWGIGNILWFIKSQVARQYLSSTLYYEGEMGEGVHMITIRDSEGYQVAVWDSYMHTLKVTC